MELHFIQEQIIKKLIGAETFAKYSELRVEGIENDLFNYHLQKLVALGFIDKSELGYRLSAEGTRLTEDTLPLGVIRQKADTFKLYSHGIVIRKDCNDLQILNRKRSKQPFYGDKGILGESVRKGQDVKTALSTRLLAQAGVLVDPKDMKFAGILRKITNDKEGNLFSDFIFYIHFCLDYTNELDAALDDGNVFWVDIDQAIQNEKDSHHPFPSLIEILKELKLNPMLDAYSPVFSEDVVSIDLVNRN